MTYSDEELRSALLFSFSPEINETAEDRKNAFSGFFGEGKKYEHELPDLKDALRKLITEDKRCFDDLAFDYTGVGIGDVHGEKLFREIWKVVMGDEPWPRDKK